MLLRLALLVLLGLAAPLTTVEDTLTIVETAPVETDLGSDDLVDTAPTWLALFESAERTIDVGSFYAVQEPGTLLEDVWLALEAAAARGVRVRFLTDERFYDTYPESFDRLAAAPGIEHRRYDMRKATGGVMHAKYLIVDERKSYVGSANFDWRSLEHIQELGLLLDSPELARIYGWAFERDWAVAGDESPPSWGASSAPQLPIELTFAGEPARVWPGLSPTGLLGDEAWCDLPRLLAWIDTATTRVWAQVLTYRTIGYDKDYWSALESALRRAAARGVDVRLQVADWGKRRGTVEGLQSLACLPNVSVRFVTIPPHSSGHIPFARVVHSKLCVIDDDRTWVGSSNWERGYFHTGRNLGAFVESSHLARRLAEFHAKVWDGAFAKPVEPGASYEAPRVGD